jgi:exportin-T
MVINADLPKVDTPDEDPLIRATTGRSYFADQLHLFEAAGNLVYLTKADAGKQITLLEAIAGPLMTGIGNGLIAGDLQAVLSVHHHLLALGNFAKGFPQVSDTQVEALPYQGPFKQMTEALLQALEGMKTQRVVRDSVSIGVGSADLRLALLSRNLLMLLVLLSLSWCRSLCRRLSRNSSRRN